MQEFSFFFLFESLVFGDIVSILSCGSCAYFLSLFTPSIDSRTLTG